MNIQRVIKIYGVVLIAGVVLCSIHINSIHAQDYYLEKHTETIINGKPIGGASVIQLWVKKNMVKYYNSNDKDNILIIRMDEDKTYQINEKEKTVQEMDLRTKFASVEDKIKVISTRTEKKKKVGEWEAYQVVLTSSAKGISTDVEYWLSEKINLPLETRMRMAGYFGQKKILEELKKYPGYPVEMIVHLEVEGKKIDMITTLIKLEKNKIDTKIFNIPSDYKKIDLFPLEKPTKKEYNGSQIFLHFLRHNKYFS
ncbi:MAG: DUF4412 domain-containing protein [bacterium]